MNRTRLVIAIMFLTLMVACETTIAPPVDPPSPSLSIASAALTDGVAGTEYVFTFTVTDLPSAAMGVTFTWDFADGTTGEEDAAVAGARAEVTLSHTFSAAGAYDLVVVVSGSGGKELARKSARLSIDPAPEPGRFEAPASFPAGRGVHSIAIADLNDDGHLDLLVTTSLDDAVVILWGDSNGGFAGPSMSVGGSNPKHAVIADLNNDGLLDFAVAIQDGDAGHDVAVFLNRPTNPGHFTGPAHYPACNRPHQVGAGDFDGDGNLDLVVACWGSTELGVLPGVGDGTFSATIALESGGEDPHAVAVADLDGDGLDDIAVAAFGSSRATVLLSRSTDLEPFLFTEPDTRYVTGDGPHGIKAADVDGDGFPDLVTANDTGDNITVLINNGVGEFPTRSRHELPTGSRPKDIAIGDLDGDGHPDIVVANSHGNHPDGTAPTTISVLYGTGTAGNFRAPETVNLDLTPFAVAIADLNGDSHLDVATANWSSGDVKVLYNTGIPPVGDEGTGP